MNSPDITVLMPVYNGAGYLAEAIGSILRQTFPRFELLIIDDRSTDHSREVIKTFGDPRLRLIENERNQGLISTLNIGLRAARGNYIARMDQDDISRPERLDVQHRFMEAHPAVGVAGAWVRKFGTGKGPVNKYPLTHDAILAQLLFENCLAHPVVMLRADFFRARQQYYDERYPMAEDYELWARCSASTQLANIPRVLLDYRVHPQSMSMLRSDEQQAMADTIRSRLLAHLGVVASKSDLRQHTQTLCDQEDLGLFLQQAHDWLQHLLNANARTGYIAQRTLARHLATRWLTICYSNVDRSATSWRMLWGSALGRQRAIREHPWRVGKFVVKQLLTYAA